MKGLLNFVLYFLVLYSIKSQAMSNEQLPQNMLLTYDNHGIEMCINDHCDYRTFVEKKISLKNWGLDKLTVQRYARVHTLICFTIQTIFSGPLSYSDMQDKYIEINNCTIDRLIIKSGVVHLNNVTINYLDAQNGSTVHIDKNCRIHNFTNED